MGDTDGESLPPLIFAGAPPILPLPFAVTLRLGGRTPEGVQLYVFDMMQPNVGLRAIIDGGQVRQLRDLLDRVLADTGGGLTVVRE